MYLAYQVRFGALSCIFSSSLTRVTRRRRCTGRFRPIPPSTMAPSTTDALTSQRARPVLSTRTSAGALGSACAMVSMVDHGMGQVVGALRSSKYDTDGSAAWDSTVLFFMSDNGGVKRHGSSNAPFRGEKGVYFEGARACRSTRPCYTRAPLERRGRRWRARRCICRRRIHDSCAAARGLSNGLSSDILSHVTDIHATVLALTADDGSEDDDTTQVEAVLDGSAGETAGDGVDLWAAALTRGASAPRTEVLINRNSATWGGGGALRRGRWKLIVEVRGAAYSPHVREWAGADDLSPLRVPPALQNSVGDSVLYRAGQAYMVATTRRRLCWINSTRAVRTCFLSPTTISLICGCGIVSPRSPFTLVYSHLRTAFFCVCAQANPSEDDAGACVDHVDGRQRGGGRILHESVDTQRSGCVAAIGCNTSTRLLPRRPALSCFSHGRVRRASKTAAIPRRDGLTRALKQVCRRHGALERRVGRRRTSRRSGLAERRLGTLAR